MQDENDIVFNAYQLDIERIARWLYEWVGRGDITAFTEQVAQWWYVFSIVSFLISALLLMGTIYAMIRYRQLSEIQQASLREAEHAYRHAHTARDEHSKWSQIETHVSSENPNDWRLAIIEADIMLDALLDSLGYSGSSIGERLKSANAESFHSVQDAWDAHKIRNQIAHRGSDFVLTKRIVTDAITKYRNVFEEFKFI